jgi:hypothetical protein
MATASKDRRAAPRHPAHTEHMAEFDIPGALVYQLKLQDISQTGAGVIVKPDSKFLDLVQVDQQFKVKLLSPRDSQLAQGIYQVRIAHITESKEGRFKGHMVVGIELLQKIAEY